MIQTKIICLVTLIDDIYDVYGTLDELRLFTDVVDRWDLTAMDKLPEYMKLCFFALYNMVHEEGHRVMKEKGLDIVPDLKRIWGNQCKSYLKEAKWFHHGQTPTLEEYFVNGWVSITSPMLLLHALCAGQDLTGEALKSFPSYYAITRSSVLTELANTIKQKASLSPCNATSILKGLNIYHVDSFSMERSPEENMNNQTDSLMSLGPTINQVREEAKEVSITKGTVEQMKGGGITDSLLVLVELLSSVKNVLPRLQVILSLERPMVALFILTVILIVIYKEMVGFAIALIALLIVTAILWARVNGIGERCREIVVNSTSDQTTMEIIVSAQHSLNNLHELVNKTNITILRIFSIIIGKAPKQANDVMWAMIAVAVLLVVIPFKYIVMGLTFYLFIANSRIAKHMLTEQGNRRLREWWESIPVIPVRTVSSRP